MKPIYMAGNMIVDQVKRIDRYPELGMLAGISKVEASVGGCLCNTAMDLAALDPALSIFAIGRVGEDENGRFLLRALEGRGIDTSLVKRTPSVPTSFSDVMSLPGGERTFFHAMGANGLLDIDDFPLDELEPGHLHIGYILLLDALDLPDREYGTRMAALLARAKERGFTTSADVVSSSRLEEYALKVLPTLPYLDYLIINEVECAGIWGVDVRPDGALRQELLEDCMKRTLSASRGSLQKLVVHYKEGAHLLNHEGSFERARSLRIPKERIAGSVGAGDAFCAGALYQILSGAADSEILAFGCKAAAVSLLAENSVDAMRSEKEVEAIAGEFM